MKNLTSIADVKETLLRFANQAKLEEEYFRQSNAPAEENYSQGRYVAYMVAHDLIVDAEKYDR